MLIYFCLNVFLDEGDRDCKIFWAALGGEVEVKPAEAVAQEPDYVKKLFR
jgi:hypothetical protein